MLQPTPDSGSGPSTALAVLTKPTVLPVAVFVWLAATAWLRPLSLPDEGRYVGVALEMLWSGNWMVPTLDTLPYFHKPPLFYWMTAASLATLGINEWAARLGSLLAATGCALGVYGFVRRWAGDAHARLALLVLLTTPFFYGGAQFANMDMLVTACIAGTILCAAHAVLASNDDGPLPHRALTGAYVLAGLGLLAKGLIGIAIPGMVIGIWLVFVGRPRMILRLVWLPGVALFGLVAFPWLLLMQARYPEFFDYFFLHHQFERFTSQGFNNPQPFWFAVAAFAGATLPWCVFLVGAARKIGQPHAGSMPRQVQILMWIWLVSTLVFFSIPKSKLIGYVMVAVPPFAALVADELARAAGTEVRARVWVTRVTLLALLICATILVVVDRRDRNRDNTKDLAARLGPLLTSPADPVVALRHYPFSLSFYLRRPQPLRVVEEWQQSGVTQRDTWRRELYEAATFDPARGKLLLLDAEAMRLLLACSSRTVWLIVPRAFTERLPKLTGIQRIAQIGNDDVWRNTPSTSSDLQPGCAP